MAHGPVVPRPGLAEHEVVRPEDLAEGTGPDAVHGARLQVHQHGPGHVLAPAGLVVVDIDPLQLEVGLPSVGAGGVNAVLVRDDLPELKHNGVTQLFSIELWNDDPGSALTLDVTCNYKDFLINVSASKG